MTSPSPDIPEDLVERVARVVNDLSFCFAGEWSDLEPADLDKNFAAAKKIITAILPDIERQALERAAKVAREHFIGIFTGWKEQPSDGLISLDEAEDVASECGGICATAIEALIPADNGGEK